ncbi:MAG: chemotaxis response regulator protein-glutamate methylesterase, partial [Candidatus Zixiibacteriota bacterium]
MPVTTAEKIRVIVVDDSAFMRKAISKMLESDPQIEVVATARDGEEGVSKVLALKPDLVTMDIEMPRMDGLTALKKIMAEHPTPVMMVSSITTEGAQATLDALEYGAVDFIPKGMSYVSLDVIKIQDELVAKIKNIVRRKALLMSRFRFRRISETAPRKRPTSSSSTAIAKRHHSIGIIAIGSSTGGPPALQEVIPRLPRNLPVGVIIAQHMPPKFTRMLADRLDELSVLPVREAENGELLEPGTVLISPGGKHITVRRSGSGARVQISDHPTETLYKPCVDVTMTSVAEAYKQAAMGVILTGMGNNGVIGIEKMKKAGGVVIAQNEESCV